MSTAVLFYHCNTVWYRGMILHQILPVLKGTLLSKLHFTTTVTETLLDAASVITRIDNIVEFGCYLCVHFCMGVFSCMSEFI